VLFGVVGFGVALLAYTSAAFVTTSRYFFLDPGWSGLRRNPQELISVPIAFGIGLLAMPVVLVL
jgi:hypothetical protein